MVRFALFQPQIDEDERIVNCEHHLEGCCFDAKKSLENYVAVPCIGCRKIDDISE